MEFVRIPRGTFQMGSPPSEKDRSGDEDLHEVIGWDALFCRQFLDSTRPAIGPVPRQTQHRPRGIIAFDG